MENFIDISGSIIGLDINAGEQLVLKVMNLSASGYTPVAGDIARIGIQKITHITPKERQYHLVTLQGLREAGERHTDLAGADTDITARGAQHSGVVKEKHYKKAGWEEIQSQVRNLTNG